MKVVRVYTGDDGESHFEDMDIPLIHEGDIGRLSEKIVSTGIIFRETGADYDYTWHNAPCRQFIVNLEGGVEIEVGDGTKRYFGPGDVILVEDTEGRGHMSRSIDNKPRKSIFVTLE